MGKTEGRYTVQITVTIEALNVSDMYREVKRAMDDACRHYDLVYVDCEHVAFLPYCANEHAHESDDLWAFAVESMTLCASCILAGS